MAGRAWTTEQEDILRRQIAAGLSHRAIGEGMGRTWQAIANRCRKLGLSNPEAARLNAAVAQRAVFCNPKRRAEISEKISRSWSPERRERHAEMARALTARLGWRKPSPEGRRRMSKGCSDWHRRRWAWLPEKYRDEYTRLARNPHIKAARAKEIIREKIAAEKIAMTPFERAMERVRQGAGITIVRPIRRPEPSFTLGGVSEL